MAFRKIGELIELSPTAIQHPDSVIATIDPKIFDSMQKFAANLKRIAPKAEDFLYFAAVMMHAAEHALLNDDGTPKLTRSGEKAEAHWDKTGGTWKWVCNDSSIRPFKNSNGDIFPEEELIKAHKKWIERPLCVDHKSNSVDHIRGIIVDAYYDRPLKRVIALCALDKKNYPELADKVAKNLSNAVSMGTGVGRAICFDCGQVAKTADDFCHHMRTKSCYGEINIDLSPIELSIVVNGADPKAKIKQIIASADAINAYVSTKEQELKKLGAAATIDSIMRVKNDLSDAMNKLAELERSLKDTEKKAEEDTNDTAFNQTNSSIAMDESEVPATELSLAPPTQRFAIKELEETVNKLALLKEAIQRQMEEVNNMSKELEKLSHNTTKEETMSGKTDELNKKGYFQGGGGLNEPAPHQVKYPIDPMQADLREKEDKQMVGQSPFPEVGDVEGMHPSPASVDTKDELERKKMVQRAELEEREIRREAALLKAKAYFQGGGGVNEPTPGKVKYPIDKLQEQDRDKEDKQMVGQKPFPGVGDVEGLHPSPMSADQKDELKRKEMLQRASLKAKFVKAAKEDGLPDFAKSAWQVWEGDKLVLTATVDEISGGRVGALYDTIATEKFAQDLMGKIRTHGAEKVASMFKSAQLQPPSPMGDAPQMPAMPGDESKGKEGDPKEALMDALQETKTHLSDAEEAARALTGEQSEMGEMPELAASEDSDSSKVSTAVLQSMRKELNADLTASLNEVVAELKEHEENLLNTIALYDADLVNDKNRSFMGTVTQELVDTTKKTVKSAAELLASFAVYCRGAEQVVKLAETEQAKQAKGTNMENDTDLMALIENTGKEIEAVATEVNDADMLHAMLADDLAQLDTEDTEEDTKEGSDDLDSNCAVITSDPMKAAEMAKQNPSLDVELKTATAKEERAAMRAKIAAEMKWNPVFYEFHPKGKATTHLDVKPEGDLGVVETLEERHDVMMDVAKAPPKVRKEAEEIQKLVAEGKLDPKTDLDVLIANGVDPETVKYWKQFYGELGHEGSQFATELVKEHAKAQAEEAANLHRVKLARAYELAYDMVERELLPRERQAISKQVDDFMKFNDEGFESYKKIIARHAPKLDKRAAVMPQVGLFETGNSANQSLETEDLASQFAAVFAKSSKRMF
jgi:hypothetical protein